MTRQSWAWYTILGMFYIGLIWLVYSFYSKSHEIRTVKVVPGIDAQFEGNDWVTWEDTKKGVIVKRVHPLYKGQSDLKESKDQIKVGDRLRKIGAKEIFNASVADKIAAENPPPKPEAFYIIRTDPTLYEEKLSILMEKGFRLGFSFNEIGTYWYLLGWLLGIGSFMGIIMLAILFPLLRSNIKDNLPMVGLVGSAFIFFMLQLFRHLYLIIENDLSSTGFEKLFILSYALLSFVYVGCYFHFKVSARNPWFSIPTFLVAGYLSYQFFNIIFLEKQLKHFHDLIEQYVAIFFLLHTIAAVAMFLIENWRTRSLRSFLGLGAIGLISALGLAYYGMMDYSSEHWFHPEHAFFLFCLLSFFPLVNATFLQLQFGKVSLVVTQSIQYLVSIIMILVLYLVITQLYDYVHTGRQYRQILEFSTLVFVVVILRLLYLANENKFRKYFVTPQQERLRKFKTFIARIPQYTNSELLRKDLIDEMIEYFNAETVHLWWNADRPESAAEERYHGKQESIYRELMNNNTVWSKTKEIATFRLSSELEKSVLNSSYTLICPITIDVDTYALLMLGRKKRGVYNLTDLELISQLIQQTQLTLNVLQMVVREKSLIQQTYEANLTALRSQINPHFLFNTLNSIGELVHESADLAEEALEKLAYIFRYTLNKSSENFVSLSDEMKLIKTYLDLEK
ncbi:MAG: histidine kinase, partial [Bacteroidota bacterium]